MGIQQTGCYELAVIAESLPGGGSDVFMISGDTDGGVCGGPTPTPGGTSLIISEFRLRGFQGANDEFVEIYNNSDEAVSVLASDGSTGYAVAASDGIIRFIIPNGTIIPARGHFLGVNSVAYGLSELSSRHRYDSYGQFKLHAEHSRQRRYRIIQNIKRSRVHACESTRRRWIK